MSKAKLFIDIVGPAIERQGFVQHDDIHSEVMSELSADYWPGVKMIADALTDISENEITMAVLALDVES